MLENCQKSCSVCIDKTEYTDCEEDDEDCEYCDDYESDCVEWALRGDVSLFHKLNIVKISPLTFL